MPQSDDVSIESKTVRVNALSYYKIVELAGLLSAVSGRQFSISQLTDEIVATVYNQLQPTLIRALTEPKLREQLKQSLNDQLNVLEEVRKNVKITE